MANYLPLKQYMFFCIDQLIDKYDLTGPFLDAGCGTGDLSKKMACRGWEGEAVDFSDQSINKTKENLENYPNIKIKKSSIQSVSGKFNTIFLIDVLEHVKEDEKTLKKINSLLNDKGYLIGIVPYNPKEWRWDDKFYGHYRRYTISEIKDKLNDTRFETIIYWDCTFPIFWLLRRIYTSITVKQTLENKTELTKKSSMQNAWNIPNNPLLSMQANSLWNILYRVQFFLFKNFHFGHEIIFLARKTK